jgi:16S rRNA (uracil1498-N3)-methyltransferase
MRQFILPEEWDGGPSCLVSGGRARYVARVLRLGPGDSFPGLDSGGRPWRCTVVEAGSDRLLLSVAPAPEGAPASASANATPLGGANPRIILVQGLPSRARMDLVVRQAAETGVFAVVPLQSSRSVARGEEGGSARKARWERIVREAQQQSGSPVMTCVLDPISIQDLSKTLESLALGPNDPRILLHESPLAQSSMHGYLTGAPDAIALCVGPEGGFSPDEVDSFLAQGFRPLRIAGAVLRAETAALYAIAAAQITLSERSSWIPKHL